MTKRKPAKRKTNPTERPAEIGSYVFTARGITRIPDSLYVQFQELERWIEEVKKRCWPILEDPANHDLRLLLSLMQDRGRVYALIGEQDAIDGRFLKERQRGISKQGGDARRKKAEPVHRAVQKRFRELRKTVPKKTARYLRVAEEFGISDRHVARIVDGLD